MLGQAANVAAMASLLRIDVVSPIQDQRLIIYVGFYGESEKTTWTCSVCRSTVFVLLVLVYRALGKSH